MPLRRLWLLLVVGFLPVHTLAAADDSWIGEKVMPRQGATLRVGGETVDDDAAVYVVKQVQDDWLWTGKGWIRERDVVRIPEAADYYSDLIFRSPQDAWAYNMRGVAWTNQGAFTNAIRDFTRALELEVTADTYANRGAAHLQQGDWEQAVLDLTRAIELEENHVVAYSNRGVARRQQGDVEGAIEDLTEAIRLDPEFAAAYSNRGECWEELGEYEKAIEDYTEAIAHESRFATPYALRARLWAACPDEEFRNGQAAIESATAACDLTGWKHPLFLDTLAAAYAEAGDFDEAVKRQEQAIELATGNETVEQFTERLELYREQKPYRLALRPTEP